MTAQLVAEPVFGGYRRRTYTLAQLRAHSRALRPRRADTLAIWRGRVDPKLREQAMLAVAQVNGCRYCAFVHEHWAQLQGATDEELARIEGLDPSAFDRDEWLAIAYVTTLAEHDFAGADDGLGEEIERRSGAQRREDLETIARSMTLANRMANTLDAFVARVRGNPDPHGRVLDEAVIASVLLLTGPGAVLGLSILLRMSPVRFVREMARLQLADESA